MELAIDFEAFAGRQLPPAPQSHFAGGDMSLQEKARVMRLITTLMGRSVGKETILPAKLTNACKSLVPMGAGTIMGLEGRPLLTRPLEVWGAPSSVALIRRRKMGAPPEGQANQAPGKTKPCADAHRGAVTGPGGG